MIAEAEDATCRELSRTGSTFKPQNGRVEGTRLAGLEARLANAEVLAESARRELLRSVERAEAARGDVEKYHVLQQEYKVSACRRVV